MFFARRYLLGNQVLLKVRKQHEDNPHKKDIERLRAKITGINSQIDALSERLAELPKTVSAVPIYKQMERLQETQAEYDGQLHSLRNGGKTSFDRIVGLDTLETFARHYKEFVNDIATFVHRRELVKKFVSKVEVGTDSVSIHFIVDQDYYKQELTLKRVGFGPFGRPKYDTKKIFKDASSSSLTFGARGRT